MVNSVQRGLALAEQGLRLVLPRAAQIHKAAVLWTQQGTGTCTAFRAQLESRWSKRAEALVGRPKLGERPLRGAALSQVLVAAVVRVAHQMTGS